VQTIQIGGGHRLTRAYRRYCALIPGFRTRGLFGICFRGKYYYFYNHWDSYLDGLGVEFVTEVLGCTVQQLEMWARLLEDAANGSGPLVMVP
jgi:hypothetical protein